MRSKGSLAYKGVLLALCLVFSYVEILIPMPVPVPGFKLGLSNIVILFILYTFGAPFAFIVGILKSLIIFLLFGNLYGLVLSLAGFVLSFGIMLFLYGTHAFSVIGISVAGGIFHNTGQLLAVCFLTMRLSVLRLMPVLSLLGAVTGLIIGFAAFIVIERFKKNDRFCKGDP